MSANLDMPINGHNSLQCSVQLLCCELIMNGITAQESKGKDTPKYVVHIPRYIVNVSNQTHNLGHSIIPQSFIQGRGKGIIVVLLGLSFSMLHCNHT